MGKRKRGRPKEKPKPYHLQTVQVTTTIPRYLFDYSKKKGKRFNYYLSEGIKRDMKKSKRIL